MESGKQPGNETRQKYRKYRISRNYVKEENKAKNTGKNGILIEPGKENEDQIIKNNVESDGEDGDKTREKQQQ